MILAMLALLGASPRAARADSVVVINEVMYHPAGDEAALEWLELYNTMSVDVDLSGWSLGQGVFFNFEPGTIIPGGGYLVVAVSPPALQAATGFAGALGPFSGRLDNAGERLTLLDNNFRVLDTVNYGDEGDWPVAPDGSGLSLARRDPNLSGEDSEAWAPSRELGGTPGAANFGGSGPVGNLPVGLVSYWRFDETGSTAADSADGNSGTFGTGTTRVAGLVGSGAFTFNNTTNAYIAVGSGTGNNFSTDAGIALEALIRPSWSGAAGDYDDIFRKEDGNNRVLFGLQNDGTTAGRDVPITPAQQPTLSFGINVGGVYSELDMPLDGAAGRPTLAALKDGASHHVAATYDSATGLKAIYVDGALAFSASLAAGSLVTSGGGTTAYIGNMSGRAEPFTGAIDEVAFWSRPLGAAEVASHHAAAQAGRGYFEGETPGGDGAALAFDELFGSSTEEGWLELVNPAAGPLAVGGYRVVAGGIASASEHAIASQTLAAGGRLILTQTQLGFALVPGVKLFLFTPDGQRVLDAAEVKDGLRGRSPSATGRWLRPSAPTPGAPNTFALEDSVVINEIHYHPRPEPAVPPETRETQLFAIDGLWRYDASGQDLGVAWRAPTFNDTSWLSGAALIYNETAALPAPKNTEIALGPTTFYFRARFEFTGDPATATLGIRTVIDDGAVFYLNGVEVFRLNMPAGPIDAATFASPGVGDADYSGPFTIPTGSLLSGTNVLAVEVHQGSAASTDVVLGVQVITSEVVSPGHPFQAPPESFVELFNRGAQPVDLTGWSLARGIRYDFEAGTVLGPGESIAVAEDRARLQALHPSARIVGDFLGRLSGSSDLLVLRDAAGNPADEVRYRDGGRWPEAADGGGSSLELRDPWADNAQPEAWAASDESLRSSWRSYSYDEVAQPNVGPTQWREFVLGLLDSGEALIDDLSVTESPGGAAVAFLSNGTFSTGTSDWRLIGNHRHSSIVTDPENPTNPVLHLVATGPTEHMHNHAETTLANGEQVTNGALYRISFRARWVSGSNQLHTRLYFNRAPQTTLLEVPALHGTPGAPNTRLEQNIGPTFEAFGHSPAVPAAGEEVAVSATVRDPDGVSAVTLWQSVNGGAWSSVAMTADGDGRHVGILPGRSASTVVQFYVEAADGLGATSTMPAAGPDSRALYRVEDGQASLASKHNLRIVMTPADVTFLHEPTNVMSNDRLGATVIYDEREATYDTGVRLKGSERGRNQPGRVGFNVKFPADRLFRGVHSTVAIDRSGGYGIGTNNSQDEILVKHMIQHAGGIPGMYDDIIRVIAPRSAQNGSALLMMARYGRVFLDSQYPNGGEGMLHELELIYYPLTTAANGLKLPEPDNVLGVDIQDLGDDKEVYRWNFMPTNNQDRDDFSGLIRLCKAFSLSGTALEAQAPAVMDVDEWMRAFAMMSLCGIGDAYTRGNNHNLRIFLRPEDGKAMAMPWDWDFSFTQPSNAGLWGDQNLQKVITRPRFLHLYYGHLKEIIATTFNTTYMSRWTAHYGAVAGASYDVFLTRISDRRNFVLASLPAAVPFAITTNNGQPFSVDAPTVALDGTGGIDVHSVVALVGDESALGEWTDLSAWRVEAPLLPGANTVSVAGLDFSGEVVALDTIVVTSTFDPPVPTISGIVPDAAAPGQTVVISGAGFLAGVKVFFGAVQASTVRVLGPGTIEAVVPGLSPMTLTVKVRSSAGVDSNASSFTVLAAPTRFIRGDANLDGVVDISDAIRILFYLYQGLPAACLDAADADNNEAVNLTDSVHLLNFLFRGGPAPPAPFPSPGADPSGTALDCAEGL